MSHDRTYFLLRKLHSLTGIIPIGTFLCAHLYLNSGALLGQAQFDAGVGMVSRLPYLPYIEWGGIIVPLVFHGLLGLYMVVVQARYNNFAYNYSRNWWYSFQRLTGVLVFAFLAWHLWDLMIAKALGQMEAAQFYGHLDNEMSVNRIYLAAFIVGCLAASFHFANGLWGFFASWGILQSRRAQRVGGWIFGLCGVVMFVAWFNIIYHFASGGANIIPVQEPPAEIAAELALE